MKAVGCAGDAFQGMTFRLQRCPVRHRGQYLPLFTIALPKPVQLCPRNEEVGSSVHVDFLSGCSRGVGANCDAFEFEEVNLD